MNLFHIGTEFRRFGHGKLPPIAIVVIMLMPLLFGGLFVWSYWDPIGHLNKLPVAVVNSDAGVTKEGKTINAGEQITHRLVDQQQAKFIEVSAEQARKGIADGTYYFAIEFPTDFSQAATSVKDPQPHQAKLNAVYNNANGFLATMLGNQVVGRVLAAVNENLGSQVANQLLVGFNTIGQGLDTAADGAGQLADGSHKAHDGADKLADGSTQLNKGLQQANDGAHKLHDGAGQLDQGIHTASNGADALADGLTKLNAATDTLGNGAGQVSAGVDKLVGVAQQASDAQSQLTVPLVNLSAQLRATGIPQAIDLANSADGIINSINAAGIGPQSDMMTQLSKLRNGASEIHRQLSDPTAQYRAGINSATEGAQKLSTGLHQLSDGSEKLVIGTKTLADGTTKLSAGSQQLTVGASQLSSGLVRLDEGASELSLKLGESKDKIPQFPEDTIADSARNVSTPVAENVARDSLSLFGLGLAPMFIALGLFMGGTVTFMLMRPLQRRVVDSGVTPFRVVLASYIPAVIVGFCQATIMFLVQRYAIGLHAHNEFLLWTAMCLTSMCFMAITQGLNTVFGSTVGRVLCIAFMSLQIVSSGGLYPPETQPAPLRWFHTFDPMTYSVNILRQAIYPTDVALDHRAVQGVIVLIVIGALFLLFSTIAAMRERQMKMKDFHPEVAV
ncbi:YhgE/Pip domain-containing protein [Corynebacterium belfantii]|uniref:YhgE/Pip domain-containing protein n=1 Tax=Corynebacterium belfantii TaxID=2014537 RepID=A0ABS0LDQ6_9CORY|nr:YhgE/Pip domain-containing protein [Corynebacterium belfantii]QVI98290.1 YhgE/Pip domain-containing protein [Corynebacterium diphtheriae]SPJ40869.1 ABC-2 family transporter protein [Corynebacterium diphtheriae subsp. lausannense]MBG9310790.1 YhgE/Pip domain-containing protein [Corynebacterium belfantii]MBG9347643.1 YhgE/Pip domain-containing protein [Corynebacterium belfantii]MBG9354806.1 YhgE/Pip domain-containing protein [Corynebacterium belfantii]